MSAILSLEPNQSYAGMLGLLVQFCTSHKEMDVVSQHKASGRWLGTERGNAFSPGGPGRWPHLEVAGFRSRDPGLSQWCVRSGSVSSLVLAGGGPCAVTGMLIRLFVLSLSHSPPSSCLVPSSVPGVGGAAVSEGAVIPAWVGLSLRRPLLGRVAFCHLCETRYKRNCARGCDTLWWEPVSGCGSGNTSLRKELKG